MCQQPFGEPVVGQVIPQRGAGVGDTLLDVGTVVAHFCPRRAGAEPIDQDRNCRAGDLVKPAACRGPFERNPPNLQAGLVRVTLDKHYRETLDQPVGILGDITPRVAAKTKKGREKLVAWLKFLENQSARDRERDDPMRLYDFSWMWTERSVVPISDAENLTKPPAPIVNNH